MSDKEKILIIHTGGTIGMKKSSEGYVPDPDFPRKIEADIQAIKDDQIPEVKVIALKELLDSSNMTPSDWNTIAGVVYENKDGFDGFIILHGTDTMAFTASALAFMLNINKPVIITGSQIPYQILRNDARENLITALMISNMICRDPFIPEVLIYFDNKLLRGCRCTKVDATHFAAFDSPNYPHLAEIGVDFNFLKQTELNIKFNREAINTPGLATANAGQASVVNFLTEPPRGEEYNVGVIRLFPGISARYAREILKPPLKGLILQAYGVGNGPTRDKNPELYDVIKRAIDEQNMVIVSVTQCLKGTVIQGDYATSLPVIPGYDMTLEAALAKLYYLLYTEPDLEKVKKMMLVNLKGELTRN